MRTIPIVNFYWISLGIVIAVLSLGFTQIYLWIAIGLVWLLALIWGVGFWRGWGWSENLFFVILVMVCGVGVLMGVWPIWCMIGLFASLMTWDLHRFIWRIRRAKRIQDEERLVQRHLQRLASVLGVGVLMSIAAMLIRLELSFGFAVLLGLLAVIALGQLIVAQNRARGG